MSVSAADSDAGEQGQARPSGGHRVACAVHSGGVVVAASSCEAPGPCTISLPLVRGQQGAKGHSLPLPFALETRSGQCSSCVGLLGARRDYGATESPHSHQVVPQMWVRRSPHPALLFLPAEISSLHSPEKSAFCNQPTGRQPTLPPRPSQHPLDILPTLGQRFVGGHLRSTQCWRQEATVVAGPPGTREGAPRCPVG